MPTNIYTFSHQFCKDQLDLCEDWMLPTDEDRDWNAEKERSRGASNPYGGMGGMGMPQDFNSEYPDVEEPEEDVGELELQSSEKEEL